MSWAPARQASPPRSRAALEPSGSVAVVMRTKDRPVLLPRALASVLSQTHQNWRLYLVNDGGDRQAFDAVLDSTGRFSAIG